MKNEEFNDFLRDRADSFELKPSSGSFDAVARKLKQKKKRRGVFILLPLLLLVAVATIFFVESGNAVNITAQKQSNPQDALPNNTAQSQSATANAAKNAISKQEEFTKESNTTNTEKVETSKPLPAINALKARKKQQANSIETQVRENSLQEAKKKKNTQSRDNIIPLLKEEIEDAKIEKQNVIGVTTKENNGNTLNNTLNPIEEQSKIKEVANSEKEQLKKNKAVTTNKPDSSSCNCNDKKWGVSAWVNPFNATYTGNESISAIASDPTRIPNQKQEFRKEIFNNGFAGAISLERRLSKRLNMGLGIGFSTWSLDVVDWTTQQQKDSVPDSYFDASTGQTVFTGNYRVITREATLDSSSNNIRFYNFQIPLQLRYALLQKKRWGLEAQINAVFNYNIATITSRTFHKSPGIQNQNIVQNTGSLPENYVEEFRNMNLTLGGGLSAYYRLANCIDVFGGLRYDRSLFALTNSATLQKRPVFMGIETGLRIKF